MRWNTKEFVPDPEALCACESGKIMPHPEDVEHLKSLHKILTIDDVGPAYVAANAARCAMEYATEGKRKWSDCNMMADEAVRDTVELIKQLSAHPLIARQL